ncbi:MAG: CpaF family protein [Candidatus Omnitrophica bacterium]|nr:CpaF family protein [Candidatus Omnitrophota bacterium]
MMNQFESMDIDAAESKLEEYKDKKYNKIKSDVHHQLIEVMNLGEINENNIDQVKEEVKPVINELLSDQNVPLSGAERMQLIDEIINEVFGLGPLETLLKDEKISDILVNNFKDIYIEKYGKLQKVNTRFRDDKHLMQVIDRIVSRVGRRVDENTPMVDARLKDGSRVNAIVPPLSLNGPSLSIRRFGVNPITLSDLLRYGSVTEEFILFLRAAVAAKLNVLISGGTGSGKTTLLNIMSSFISPDERIVTIEDSAELILQQPHWVRLETRPPNIEGKGQVTQRELVFNALRMRPDRIIVGEVRGGEALDMLQAMNTGHEGSLTTVHANTPRDSLSRIEMMVSMCGMDLPVKVIRQQVASAIHLIIQTARLIDGRRRLISISEIVGMEGDIITINEIFKFQRRTVDSAGNVIGEYIATGVRPKCMEKIDAAGIELPIDLFEPHEIEVQGAVA